MSRALLCVLLQGAVALDLLDKTNVDLVTKAVSDGINDIVKEQKDKLDHLKNYSFAEFRKQFSRAYEPGQPEFIKRQKIFKKNLQYLIQHNEGPVKTYMVGINKFMDYSEDEFQKLLGYKRTKSVGAVSFLEGAIPQWNDTIKAVALPNDHDWRTKLTRSQHWFQDQGACGSCWATAAVACLQGHLEIKHGISDLLSTQALVSCTPNPRHCGGTGGCQGATAELAFEYIANQGIPADSKWPYMSFTGANGKCTPSLAQMTHAKIDHHVVLPENKGEPLLQALYQEGPVVVSVDASTWNFYSGGVFSGCDKNAIINHAVVAEGFGEQSGHKYYLIKNSWGADWGEKGYIRLMRFDDDEAHCGIDTKPEEGTACDGGPSQVRVCGMCGVLYDSTYPRGARFISKQQGGTFDEKLVAAQLPLQEGKAKLMSMLTSPLRR
eukprot:gnl/MRDRNA2_/MRDRNA2_86369_c0_seq15.p1 gnl/MRDRNA2_/MRDRNA2_86369_c0~~gnl/MRDRNA2_/MRDRNA2_86369_c0_seq15.p1  ORF type:complete len:436 (+),score=99.71 gnl/MRDRNA2_/MRDRNA2_86369_c0_seq15:66-1373(+)